MKHLEFIRNLPQYPQKSPEWLEQRKHRLTSSDAATALGINPYKKPVELLLEKCGAGRTFFGNESTLHGEKYEEHAINKYETVMGKKNHTFGLINWEDTNPLRKNDKYKDPKYFVLAGSPDGISEDLAQLEKLSMLEVKCPMRRKIKHGQIPEYYYPQVQLNMFILDLEIADFVEFIPAKGSTSMELNLVRVHRNEEWFDKIFPILKNFWDQVLEWRQRDITTHPEYNKYYTVNPPPVLHEPEFLFVESDSDPERPRSDDEGCMFI